MNVFPDFDAVNGAGGFADAVGALLMFVLVIGVLMLIICAIAWAVCASTGNAHGALKARVGCFVAAGAAALAGAGVAWANFLLTLGDQI